MMDFGLQDTEAELNPSQADFSHVVCHSTGNKLEERLAQDHGDLTMVFLEGLWKKFEQFSAQRSLAVTGAWKTGIWRAVRTTEA